MFAESLRYLQKELEELKTQAVQYGIELPPWLEIEPPARESLEPGQIQQQNADKIWLSYWVDKSKATIHQANSILETQVSTSKEKAIFVWKNVEKELKKLKQELGELQESVTLVLLVLLAGIPVLKGRIAEESKIKPSASEISHSQLKPDHSEEGVNNITG